MGIVAKEESLSNASEEPAAQERDPWDPCALTFYYFSGAECPPASLSKKEPDSFFRRPERPSLCRSASELMPQLHESKESEAPKTEWGGPDPTCYELPADQFHRTYSSSAVWNPAESPVVPLPITTGIGFYRRDPNSTREWCEEKYKAHVAELGPIAARACGAYELAGIQPEPISNCRKDSFASFSSNCTTSSQYSEVVDDQGKVMKVYRGFAVPARSSTSSLTRKSADARRNSASSATDQGDGPYSRQVIRLRSRKSFLKIPELLVEDAPKAIPKEEEPPISSRTKSSVNLEMATPGHAESAIDSDSDSWEELTPEIIKKASIHPPKHQSGKVLAGKRTVAGRATDHRCTGLDRSRTAIRKPTGGALRRHSSHDKPALKCGKAKVQLAIAKAPAESILSGVTIGHDVTKEPEEYNSSVVSEAEMKREQGLAILKEDDVPSDSSTSSEKTVYDRAQGTQCDRSRIASGASSHKALQISEAAKGSLCEKA